MARQLGRQVREDYDVPWENIMDDRIYSNISNQGQKQRSHPIGTGDNARDHNADDIGTFGRRSTNSNRTNRNSDYLQLMEYQMGGSQYSLSDPTQVYDNPSYSREHFPAGRYKKHRTYSESTSGSCNRPCVIGAVVFVVVIALAAAGVGIYFGLFRQESMKVTPTPATQSVYTTELRLRDQTWDTRLLDPNSSQFAAMKTDVQSDLTTIMLASSLRSKYQSVEVTSFSPGSIKVQCLMRLLEDALSAEDVKSSLIESYNSINKISLKVTKDLDTVAITISVTQTTTIISLPPTSTPVTPLSTVAPSTLPTTTTTTPTTQSTTTPTTTTTTSTTTTTTPTTTTTTPITTTTTTTAKTITTTTTTRTTTTTTPTTTTKIPITITTTTPTTTTTTTATTTPTTTSITTSPTTTTIPTTTTTPLTTTPTTTTTTPKTTTPTPAATTTTSTTTTPTPTTTTTTTSTTTTQPTTTTTTNPTTTTTTSIIVRTTAGPATPDVCRNSTLAIQFLFECFDFQTFLALSSDDAKCTYLAGVGNCLQTKIETTYSVACSYSDQLNIINSFAGVVSQALQFDLIAICDGMKRAVLFYFGGNQKTIGPMPVHPKARYELFFEYSKPLNLLDRLAW
ncbi:mucin-2-like [Ylistrum balloti]|uniref:mucin-2-like n=1 Tax=Ylistrum balloti TaxID=509963 RepID=UPI002905B4A4|nr:mucin-2-like [Ylistrum balloti]